MQDFWALPLVQRLQAARVVIRLGPLAAQATSERARMALTISEKRVDFRMTSSI